MPNALGIDVGTTNAKVALVGSDGRLVASGVAPIPMRSSGDVAEQDPEDLWTAVVDATRRVVAAAPGAAAEVGSIGVCSQYSSIVPVDGSGRAVADLVLYLDQRGTPQSWAILERHADAFEVWLERHGVPPVGGGLSLGHLLHFRDDCPEVHAATAAYLEPMDYVNLQLTGRIAATQCTMFTSQVCDNRTLGVTEYDTDLVAMAGLDPAKLPELIGLDGVVGELGAKAAEALGIPEGAVVRAGMNDSHAAALATGAYVRGRAGVMIGTTAVLLDAVDSMATDLDNELVAMPTPVPGKYLAWAENGIAGKALEHVLDQILFTSDELGDNAGGDPFAALEGALAAAPAGAGGVLFLPWMTGSLAPRVNSSMRGGFLNLSLDTRRTDLVRAVVEGIAHNLAWLVPIVEQFTGNRIDELVFAGGAARSLQWAQVIADVVDRPVRSLANPETAAARAVGIASFDGAEGLDPVDERVASLMTLGDPLEPEAANRSRYDDMHEQFLAAFEAVRPICEALNRHPEESR